MAARRMGLFGASDSEREARLTQQRDYAAQLQEQVRLKNARAEEERARRRQEQQAECELLDTLQPSRHRHGVQQPPPSPAKSPQQSQLKPIDQQPPQQEKPQPPTEPQVQHGTAMLGSSPWKHPDPHHLPWSELPTINNEAPSNTGASSLLFAPLVSPFSPGPSIFDTLITTVERSAFDNQFQALQKTRQEIENAWKQRRMAMQGGVSSRPSFILPPSPIASSRIAFAINETVSKDEIEVTKVPEEEIERPLSASSSSSGLVGESVLIPLPQQPSLPSESLSVAQPMSFSRSPPRGTAAHRRLAAAVAAAASSESPLVETSVFQHENKHLFK